MENYVALPAQSVQMMLALFDAVRLSSDDQSSSCTSVAEPIIWKDQHKKADLVVSRFDSLGACLNVFKTYGNVINIRNVRSQNIYFE